MYTTRRIPLVSYYSIFSFVDHVKRFTILPPFIFQFLTRTTNLLLSETHLSFSKIKLQVGTTRNLGISVGPFVSLPTKVFQIAYSITCIGYVVNSNISKTLIFVWRRKKKKFVFTGSYPIPSTITLK